VRGLVNANTIKRKNHK